MEVDLDRSLDVLVVGGGVSGLTAAWRLHSSGYLVLLCHGSERFGGAITTEQSDEFLCEGGPNSFQRTTNLDELIASLGIEDQRCDADARLPRYVWWEGRLRAIPFNVSQFLRSDLLSWGGKTRFMRELLVPRLDDVNREETVSEFIYRRCGEEIHSRLFEPLISGIFAGDIGQLSASATLGRAVAAETNYGSILRSLWLSRERVRAGTTFCTFKEGMETLTNALGSSLGSRLWCERTLISLERIQAGWRAVVSYRGDLITIHARSVLLATPAMAAAELLAPLDDALYRSLASIYSPPIAVISLGYQTTQIPQPLEGFGHLIPRGQGLRTLGSIWNCSLFPHRAPSGWRQFTTFIGGTTDTASAGLSDQELITLAHQELQSVLGIQGTYRCLRVTRWQQGIPQYALGHLAKQKRVELRLERWPGLFLCGNYFGGISIGDCVNNALKQSSAIQAFLASPQIFLSAVAE
ncbi:MAG: protoporphyrinogen oxidase [Anaerolineae bacterium]|nr:protoporphyrinogen oxidase [Gloeobacterales cyanobacterium ES-bin-313]